MNFADGTPIYHEFPPNAQLLRADFSRKRLIRFYKFCWMRFMEIMHELDCHLPVISFEIFHSSATYIIVF